MSRVAAWQKRPGSSWSTTHAMLQETTLYLVARQGPLVFSVRDEHAAIFKVVLGNPHSCSCSDSLNTGDLCIHQLYCLMKVLRVSDKHPLCYQLGITDTEADMILGGQCGDESTRGAQNGRSVENLSAMARAKRLAKQKGKKDGSVAADEATEARANGWVERQVLGEGDDENCAICQDSMTKDQALTWCRKGCGNNIHAKCMQTFAQYKISNRQPVACPLCREEWNIELLKDDLRGKAALKNSCAPIYCHSCTHSLRSGPFYRCLECSHKKVCATHLPILDYSVGEGNTEVLGIEPPSMAITGPNALSGGNNSINTLSTGLIDTSGNWNTPPISIPGSSSASAISSADGANGRAKANAKPVTPSSSLAAKRTVDFCESCFTTTRLSKEHTTHHFLRSEANGDLAASNSASGDAEDNWAVVANPLHAIRTAGTRGRQRGAHENQRASTPGMEDRHDELLTEALSGLESREITMDDYELLLELDRTPNSSISVHLCKALPKYRGQRGAGSVLPLASDCYFTDELSPEECWCCKEGESAQVPAQIAQSTLRSLPCGHIAHDWCLSTAVDRAHTIDGTQR